MSMTAEFYNEAYAETMAQERKTKPEITKEQAWKIAVFVLNEAATIVRYPYTNKTCRRKLNYLFRRSLPKYLRELKVRSITKVLHPLPPEVSKAVLGIYNLYRRRHTRGLKQDVTKVMEEFYEDYCTNHLYGSYLDPRDWDVETACMHGMIRWANNLFLIPIYMIPLLHPKMEVENIFRDKYLLEDIDDYDVRCGCIAYGVRIGEPMKYVVEIKVYNDGINPDHITTIFEYDELIMDDEDNPRGVKREALIEKLKKFDLFKGDETINRTFVRFEFHDDYKKLLFDPRNEEVVIYGTSL